MLSYNIVVASNKASVVDPFDLKPYWVERMISRLNKNEFKSRVGVFETNFTGAKQNKILLYERRFETKQNFTIEKTVYFVSK